MRHLPIGCQTATRTETVTCWGLVTESSAVYLTLYCVLFVCGAPSGDFESMLLKVTRPDDQRPPEDVVGAILDATGTFYRDEDVSAGTNPYRVTLRKLWTKMAERDWRTVAKALYVFHVLLR